MGGDQGGEAGAAGQPKQHGKHVPRRARVEVAGGLVGEQQLGRIGKGAGDGDPLLFAARELAGGVAGAIAQVQPSQQLDGSGAGVVANERGDDVPDGEGRQGGKRAQESEGEVEEGEGGGGDGG